jgi:cyclic pyranopterin phosphate synthase
MLRDQYQRPVRDLRISVTDRCNYRCTYCMPLDEYVWIERQQILTYEEIARLARLFIRLGVTEIRITGGEPLVRKDLHDLVGRLSRLEGLRDLSLTTNGALLPEKAEGLWAAGLRRLNVSLDTLDPERFRRITQRGDLAPVLEGLFLAKRLGFRPIKLNAVIERGVNEQDILPLVEFARSNGFGIRFIEYMDVGNSNNWHSERMVSKQEILTRISAHYRLREVGREGGTAPAVDYALLGGGDVGVIASVTEPFCSSCTRARLTADGKLVTCLFSHAGHDLKALLRTEQSDDQIEAFLRSIWSARTDRYSDERLEAMKAGLVYQARKKIEMITLGG